MELLEYTPKLRCITVEFKMVLSVLNHHANDETVAQATNAFKQKLPRYRKKNDTCIGIVLAGDAPDAKGNQQVFHKKSAQSKAKQIAKYIKKSSLCLDHVSFMITNGPCTGKFSFDTKLPIQPDPHKNGIINKPTDIASIAFLEELQKHFPDKKFHFYNFQYGQPSAYLPMMHRLCKAKHALWFVPAESTSMITESGYLAAKKIPVVVYIPSSANKDHLKVVEMARRNHMLHYVNTHPSKAIRGGSVPLTAPQIAEGALQKQQVKPLQPTSCSMTRNSFFTPKRTRIALSAVNLTAGAALLFAAVMGLSFSSIFCLIGLCAALSFLTEFLMIKRAEAECDSGLPKLGELK